MNTSNGMNWKWLFLMAWRDSRKNRSRLLLFVSSIILGISALVGIYSLGDNLRQNVDQQAATLLGADLEISSGREPLPEAKALIDSLDGEQSAELNFASMVLFPATNGTRLVQIRALEGAFPYYGDLETKPVSAARSFRNKRGAVVDQTLMLQYNAKQGDSIYVGDLSFVIEGTLMRAPGRTGFASSVAPAVYIPLQYLEQTGLLQKGSRINYKYYYKFQNPAEAGALADDLSTRLDKLELDYETIESQKRDTGRSFEDLTRFLALVGFIALLLGCIGVASAIHIYIREKVSMIAVLRCLGVKGYQAFLIYLIQIVGIGLIGSIAGAILGAVIQQFLPLVLEDFLPVKITTSISWWAILQGIITGVVISFLFALLPLLSIRNISPLNTLRISFQSAVQRRDPLKFVVYGLIILFVLAFTYFQLRDISEAITFTVGIIIAFAILSGIANLLIWAVRRFFPLTWSYLWRQGLSNLYRPNNQTVILVISIGLGTAFISTLILVQSILLNRITISASGDQPNIVLFDIQTEQRQGVMNLARSQGLPVKETVPIVNMRLDEINGISAAEAQEDTSLNRARWVYGREYRVTYRDTITPYETITEGEWNGTAKDGNIYISIEERYAKNAVIKLGDTVLFNVQGAIIPTIVGSFREVDWNRIQTNFLVVFPKGVLEEAPQFHVLLTRVPSIEASAKFQQAIVKQFPNISIIDLALILNVLDDIFSKIGFVIRFIAGFSILTGIVVLIASVLISKFQRIQESVLLRTLGASRSQIFTITALEYFFLGSLAAATGILLSMGASWALAHYTFKTNFAPPALPIIILFFAVSVLTVLIGMINSREVLSRPPLEVLRQE